MVFKKFIVDSKRLLWGLKFASAALFNHSKISKTDDIAIVVFSKDRPVQIEALLRSALKFFKGNCSWHILWQASNSQISQTYSSVFSSFSNQSNFKLKREVNFKSDLVDILVNSKHRGVIFMVDDLLFIDYFDASNLIGLDPLFEIASLRLWPGNSYCQPRNCSFPPPPFESSSDRPWLKFSWTESRGDWSMPISLDGHLFSRSEILRLIKHVQYKAPNSLETSLGDFSFLFKKRKGLCRPLPVIRNFAFNRVQLENEDFPCGSWNPERMLEKWHDGWQLNIESLAALDAISCHVDVDPEFELRDL